MADIVELMAFADQRIKNNDIGFTERVDVALALLKSLGILSHQRANLTCTRHRLFCGGLVSAYDNNSYVEVYSRRQGDLHLRGQSTRCIDWLDGCVAEGSLIPPNPRFTYAKGKLELGTMLNHYLAYATKTFSNPVVRDPNSKAA